MLDGDFVALLRTKRAPRRFRQSGFVAPQQVAHDVVKGRHNGSALMRNPDAGMCPETFRAADVAVGAHVDDRLLMRVDPKPPQTQRMRVLDRADPGAVFEHQRSSASSR